MTNAKHVDDVPGHEGAVDHDGTDDHGVDSERDDRAHAEEPLGPIDVPAWTAGVVGVLLGLAVILAFVLATGEIRPV